MTDIVTQLFGKDPLNESSNIKRAKRRSKKRNKKPPYHRKHKTASCKVTLAQYSLLKEEAERRGTSLSALILTIIEDFLAKL